MSNLLRLLLMVVLLAPLHLLAQVPAGINYQAVARDANGDALSNTLVSVRFSVRDGSPTGTELFAETHTGITTNAFGLFTLTIGEGTIITGDLSTIDWDAAERFLSISIDPSGGAAFTPLTTVQLVSVPYALHAQTARFAETIAPGAGDNWGTQTVIASGLLSGDGTPVSPLELGGGAATNGQILQWNGSSWAPATVTGGVGDNWGSQVAQTGGAISGDGSPGSPIELIDGAASGHVLVWNGSSWVSQPAPSGADNWGTQVAQVSSPLVGDGTTANPLGLSPGAADGHVLTWNAGTGSWISAAPTGVGASYTAGNGIFIDASNSIINDAWSVNANGVFNDQDNIGIGVNTPVEFLNVVGGNALVEAGGLYVANGATLDRFEAFVDADDAGRVNIFGPGGLAVATLRSQGTGFTDLGAVGVMEENGVETATLFGDSAGVFATASNYNTGSFNHVLGFQSGEPDKPQLRMFGPNDNLRVEGGVWPGFGNDFGYLAVDGPSSFNVYMGAQFDPVINQNTGALYVYDAFGNIVSGFEGANVFASNLKTFRADHPEQPSKQIVYACIEGPEAATYFRGTAQLKAGKATIEVPEHFQLVSSETDMTVVLTPLDASSKGLAATQKSLKNGIVVQELMNGKGNYRFDYEVKTLRKGFEDFEVVQDKIMGPPRTERTQKLNERYRVNREPVKSTRPAENRR